MNEPAPSDNRRTPSGRPTSGYCLRCGTRLSPPIMTECPKCRLQFNPDDRNTYAAVPLGPPNPLKSALPGFCLSVVLGVGSYAVLALQGNMSLALFVAVPLSFGAMLGYTVRATPAWLGLLGVMAVITVAWVIVSLSLSGLFCGLVLSIFMLVPTMVGVLLGALLRLFMKRAGFGPRGYLPLVLIALFPFGVQAVDDRFPHPVDIATVRTEMILPVADTDAWNNLMFYEEVKHEPPWLLKLSLPQPLRAEGSMSRVGDRQRCIYNKGHLTKQITQRIPRCLLAFTVIEQQLHFERDVTLLDGSFRLQPLGLKKTRMTLTTRYRRHLRPAWMWKPLESTIVHTLHRHVMEGVRRKAIRQENTPRRDPSHPEYTPPPKSSPSVPRLTATQRFD